MKKSILVLLISILGISINLEAQTYDFKSLINGNTIYFKVKNTRNKSVEIVSELSTLPYYKDNTKKPLGKLILPDTVIDNGIMYFTNSIGDNAFSNCSEITSVTIPSLVVSIGKNAFQNCTSIDSVFFNAEKCKYFGEEKYLAFDGCNNLKTLVIGDNVTRIPGFAFAGVISLTTIVANPINPPKIKGNTFRDVPREISVYIYYSALENYKEDYFWKEFNN
ncbi:MAG TPA: leucine-rich repeat protein [Bacteroidales bacterium]|nr:leucine-rich repeat protein [Bacteroidales bacterium]